MYPCSWYRIKELSRICVKPTIYIIYLEIKEKPNNIYLLQSIVWGKEHRGSAYTKESLCKHHCTTQVCYLAKNLNHKKKMACTLNSKRNHTFCFRTSTQNVRGLGPLQVFSKGSLEFHEPLEFFFSNPIALGAEFQWAFWENLYGVLDPWHFECSSKNKEYSFFWSWVYYMLFILTGLYFQISFIAHFSKSIFQNLKW